MPRVAQRDRRRGASDEVVCVLADAFGFESADDYGRANEATLSRLRAQARRARALAKVNAFVSRHGLAFSPPMSPPTISEQQVQFDNEVLDWLRRRLDSPQRILSHVPRRLERTAMPADERKRRRNAADRARRVRLRQAAVSAAETAAAQNEPLVDEQQRVLDTSAPHTPSHHHDCQHHHYNQHAAQQQLEQERQRKWLSAFDRKWGFRPPDRKAAWESAWELRLEGRRCFKAQRRWRFFLKWPLIFPDLR